MWRNPIWGRSPFEKTSAARFCLVMRGERGGPFLIFLVNNVNLRCRKPWINVHQYGLVHACTISIWGPPRNEGFTILVDMCSSQKAMRRKRVWSDTQGSWVCRMIAGTEGGKLWGMAMVFVDLKAKDLICTGHRPLLQEEYHGCGSIWICFSAELAIW